MSKEPFDIPAGLFSDDTSYANKAAYRDGYNMRFNKKRPEVIGGWEKFLSTLLSGVCRNVLPWTDNDGNFLVAFGTHIKLQVALGSALYDISPTGLPAGNIDGAGSPGYGVGGYGTGPYGQNAPGSYYARTWSLNNFGQSLIASPRGGMIYWWQNDTAVVAAPLDNAPEQNTYVLVTPARQVIAFGTEEVVSGDFNALCVRGSDIDGKIDVWTPSNANNSFEEILEGSGPLIAARLIVGNLVCWSTANFFTGEFVGDPSQTYRFTRIEGGKGLVSPNAAIVVGQTVYWISLDLQLWSYGYGLTPVQIVCPISEDTFGKNMTPSQGDKITMAYIPEFNEIRIDYPDVRDGYENSRQAIINLNDGSWSKGDVPRTAFHGGSPLVSPLGVNPAGQVYFHERGNSADGEAIDWYIETNDFSIDELETNSSISCFYPDFKDQIGPVNLTIYTRQQKQISEQYPERTIGPLSIPANKGKVDFRTTGKIARYRIEGNTSPTFARFGVMHFEVKPAGSR